MSIFIKLVKIPKLVPFVLLISTILTGVGVSVAHADGGSTVSGSLSMGSNPTPSAYVIYNASDGSNGQGETDSNGNYSIQDLPNDSYTAHVIVEGDGTTAPSAFNALSTSPVLTVDGSNVTKDFAFNLAEVAVTVEDGSGNLAPGASVTLTSPEDSSLNDVAGESFVADQQIVSTVTTNSNGVADLAVIPGITYTVCATLSGGATDCAADLTVNSNTTDSIDFPPTFAVSGSLSMGSNPTPSAYVIYNASDGSNGQGETDSNGNYSIQDLPNDSYTALVSHYLHW